MSRQLHDGCRHGDPSQGRHYCGKPPPQPQAFSPEAQGIVNAQKSAAPFHAVCNHDCEACAGG